MASPWELSSGSAALFPTSDTDRLENEGGYFVWNLRMKTALHSCKLWGVVTGDEPKPAVIKAGELSEWEKKDTAALALIFKCCKTDVLVKIAHADTSRMAWDTFKSEYSQTGSGSVMLWFRRLTKQLSSGSDVAAHVTSFQEATRHLANAGFIIPEPISAAILLSTLPADPKDPESWNNHVAGVRIDLQTTTLSSVINGILEEKRRLTDDDVTSEAAHAALEKAARKHGRQFCHNCKKQGHIARNCFDKGGGKEGQAPWQRKKKGKEKAHTMDGGGDDSGEDVNSSYIRFEQFTAAPEAAHILYFEDNLSSLKPCSETPGDENLAYNASTNNSHPFIINSSTSSHIHSNPAHFVPSTLKPTSSVVKGFGEGSLRISN